MQSSNRPIDNLFLHLIALLQRDGRKSLVDLADEIGVSSHNTVRNRLAELQKKNIIRITAETNAKQLDLEIVLILYSTVTAEDHSKILKLYTHCPRVFRVGSLIGNYDVFIFAFAENRAVIESLTRGHCFYADKIQVRDRQVLILGEEVNPPYFPIEFPVVSEKDEAPCKASCIDCVSYQKELCTGCPATSYYRGPLVVKKE
ncbi:MAG: Lrp/AsnC family transcriptional regulator [Candidatus Heimdallarchaeaceae archaeon]